jgi:hypothetical protein
MRQALVSIGLLATILGGGTSVCAAELNGEYVITVMTTPTLGVANSYTFEYHIKNINQSSLGYPMTGLDGFFIQLPNSATISEVTCPDPYDGTWGGYWVGGFDGWDGNPEGSPPFGTGSPVPSDKIWLGWWGVGWDSVYPINEEAVFSFRADGVALGLTTAVVDTFWSYDGSWPGAYCYSPHGTYYAEFATTLIGPVTIIDDSTPPTVDLKTDIATLWPPNHQMVPVAITLAASDACTDPAGLLIVGQISCNEPDDGRGDGSFTGDVNLRDGNGGQDAFTQPLPLTFMYDPIDKVFRSNVDLRAERDGAMTGRSYSISCDVSDASGNLSTAACVVVVPHDKRKK